MKKVHNFAARKLSGITLQTLTPMELKHIISFYFVAETLSFTAAARLAHLTQSAVSQHVMALETELGSRLIDRNVKPLQLTESGEIFYAHARSIIKEAQAVKDDIASLTSELHGTLRVGVGSFIGPFVRHCAIEMMRRYPKVRIIASFNEAKSLNLKLHNHEIDLAFTMNMSEPEEGIESAPCIPFSIKAVMSRTHPLASQESVSYDDILKHYVILPDAGKRVYATIQSLAPMVSFDELKLAAIVNSPGEILEAVSMAHYVTFMPDTQLARYPELVAKPVDFLPDEIYSNAHWLKDSPVKHTMAEFMRIMKEYTIPYYNSMRQ